MSPYWLLLLPAAVLLAPIALLVPVYTFMVPARLELTPVDEGELPDEAVDLVADMREHGFDLAGPAVRDNSPVKTLIVPLLHPGMPAYGIVYVNTVGNQPQVLFDITTVFEDELCGLTTGNLNTAALPSLPGDFKQTFPGAAVADLVEHHRAALQWLKGFGVRVGLHSPERFAGHMARTVAAQRSFLLRRVDLMPVTFWRMITKTSPFMRPLMDQPGAMRQLQKGRAA